MQKVKARDEALIKFRQGLVQVFRDSDDIWLTAEDIFNKVKGTVECTLGEVANNLRMLKRLGILAETLSNGKRIWSYTGHKYEEIPPVRLVVAFPKVVHEKLCEVAKAKSQSRTGFIVESVQKALDNN